jgi:hypothetical protein
VRWSGGLLVTLAVLGALVLGAPAANAAPVHISDPCVKVAAHNETHHAHVGDVLLMGVYFKGCGRSVFIHYHIKLTGPCLETFRDRGHFRVSSRSSVGDFVQFTAKCAGTYRIYGEALHDGVVVDSSSRRTYVQP